MISVYEDKEHLTISDVGEILARRPATIRGWERSGVLPEALRGQRTDRGWRYWTHEQVEGIRAWILEEDRRPGKGLKNYKPTREQVEAHITKARHGKRVGNDL